MLINLIKNTIEQIRNKLGNLANQVEIFLFPDNKSNGELETLLIQIAKQNEFVECFDNYINCIESKDKEAVKNIYKKSKMYAYQEVDWTSKEIKKLMRIIKYLETFYIEKKYLVNILILILQH